MPLSGILFDYRAIYDDVERRERRFHFATPIFIRQVIGVFRNPLA
jgi:hypothetical protein